VTSRSFTGAFGRFAVRLVQVVPPSGVRNTYGVLSPWRNPLNVTYTVFGFVGSMTTRDTHRAGRSGEVTSVHVGPADVVFHR